MKSKDISLVKLVLNLFSLFDKKGKRIISFSLLIAGLGAITEVICLQIFRFLLNPDQTPKFYLEFIDSLNGSLNTILCISITFIFFISINVFLKVLSIRMSTYSASLITTNISGKLMREIIYTPFEYKHKSTLSESLTLLSVHTQELTLIIHYILNTLYSTLLLIGIFSGMFYVIGPSIIISLGLIFISYSAVTYSFQPRILRNNLIGKTNTDSRTLILNEVFGSLREIIIYSLRNQLIDKYKKTNYKINSSKARNLFYNGSPRFLIEALILGGFALYIGLVSLNSKSDINTILGSLALFSYGSIRLLTNAQNIYNSIGNIWSRKDEIKSIINCLKRSQFRISSLSNTQKETQKFNIFTKNLFFDNVSFKYKNKETVFSLINLSIRKGDKILVYGISGAGKSTFFDLITGLLIPQKGSIYIDDKKLDHLDKIGSWHKNIAYVPQKPFAFKDTLFQNLLLSKKEFSPSLKSKAIKSLKFADLLPKSLNLVSFQDLLDFQIEENGSNLSGGQLQRLSIARAIFSGRKVILLDEPTSAIDEKSSKKIVNNFLSLDKNHTVLIITHNTNHTNLLGHRKLLIKNKSIVEIQ